MFPQHQNDGIVLRDCFLPARDEIFSNHYILEYPGYCLFYGKWLCLKLGELFLKAKDVFNQLQIRVGIGNCQNIFRDTPLLAAYTVDNVDVIYTVYTIQTALHCL